MKSTEIKNPIKSWWTEAKKVEKFIQPIREILMKYHKWPSDEFTIIYNVVYKVIHKMIIDFEKKLQIQSNYTEINPRYLLWMLVSEKNEIPEGSQFKYMIWLQKKMKIFMKKLQDENTNSVLLENIKEFDAWLLSEVRKELKNK